MEADAGRVVEIAALGRPFSLGMLYDCRQDKFIPGITLWDHDDLVKHIGERSQNRNDFELVASESIQDKYSALNVEGSVKASLFGGFLKGGGSAKYLHDDKMSRNKARVSLTYDATTKFQELSMDHLGKINVKHPEVFEKGLATHVVTGILYGARAVFVFEHDVSSHESHQHAEGYLRAIVKKIPVLGKATGEGSMKLEDKDIKKVKEFSCKFHGDFLLAKTPTTFQDAIEVYQSLPKLLGANGENAIPMTVWLWPLTNLDCSAAKVVHEISPEFIKEVQDVLEDLREVEMRCNDAMSTPAQQFDKKIKAFKDICSGFKQEFQRNLAKKLLSIRKGEEKEEAVLTEIQKKRHSSPFNSKNLNEWLDCSEKEIYILNFLTNMMKNTKIVSSQNDFHKEILSAEYALCFIYTPLRGAQPYLSALSNYLKQSPEPDDPKDAKTQDIEEEQWHSTKEIVDAIKSKAKRFSDFAEANMENKNIKFLMMGSTNETQKGSSICLYEDGFSVNENFEPPSKPETATVSDINHNSVTLKISPPRFGVENVTSYSVEYCVSGQDGWQQKTASKAEEVTVTDLSPNTEYVFRCRAVTSIGVGPANEVNGSIKTLTCSSAGNPPNSSAIKRLADAVKEKSTLLELQAGPLPVYKVPLNEEKISVAGCRCFSFGKESTKPNRTIMALGATGAGKSTLINGMINYILGVEWKDSYRFRLVDEDPTKSQAESQTSEVTVYRINYEEGFKIDHSLTIIDTPGFGDVRGKGRDKEITEQLRNLFSAQFGVSEIDAVCFVAQAALARLTPSQKYVFDSVLSIFGKDVAENIRVLVTFADGERPPVLEAIIASGVPCPKTKDGQPVHFQFNNSALFSNNKSAAGSMSEDDGDGGFGKMFWNMGIKSMKRFFDALSVTDTKSLTLTKEVLRKRRQLEESVENLQKQVKFGLAKLEEIKETAEKLKDNEAEIKRNENFEFEVTVTKPVKVSISYSGFYLTNCQQCHYTCHYPCGIPNDADKRNCSAMGSNGHCKKCPGRCHWNVHYNQKYKWDYEEVKEKRTVKELKEKYVRASGAETLVQSLIDKLKAEYDLVQAEVMKLMERSAKCLMRLKEISLMPDPLSTPEYIDMLIEEEKSEAKSGWKQRVQYLITMREKAELMAKVDRGELLLQSPQ